MNTPQGPRHVEITLIPHRAADGSVRGLYSLVNDLTDRHEAELQRARSEERLSLALEGSGLALFDWDIANDRLYHSAKASAMLNEPAIETVTSAAEMRAFLHPDDLNAMFARMREAVTGATPTYQAEFRIRQRGGSWLWLRAIGRVVQRNAAGKALRLAGTYADINERKLSEQRLRHLAEFDTLTDLPNRAQFHDRLQQAMGRATREQAMALLFLDIDHFKSINDTLGHEAGDQLLKAFAGRMRETVRLADTVARLGGDEFTIILEGLRDLGDARSLANKLVNTFQQPIVLAGQPLRITISIGVAMCRTCETADALLGRADAALYEAKRLGRNRSFCDETTQKLDGVDAAAG
jgi:diguanylate cyclase (GGDEF)-like protein/PAS domain S-box-containing protein